MLSKRCVILLKVIIKSLVKINMLLHSRCKDCLWCSRRSNFFMESFPHVLRLNCPHNTDLNSYFLFLKFPFLVYTDTLFRKRISSIVPFLSLLLKAAKRGSENLLVLLVLQEGFTVLTTLLSFPIALFIWLTHFGQKQKLSSKQSPQLEQNFAPG